MQLAQDFVNRSCICRDDNALSFRDLSVGKDNTRRGVESCYEKIILKKVSIKFFSQVMETWSAEAIC